VDISNITTCTVNIPPHALICELQPVTIQNTQTADDKEFSQPLLEQVKFHISNLTHEEYEIGKKLITDYNTLTSSYIDGGMRRYLCLHGCSSCR
jgi:hypothetical protein